MEARSRLTGQPARLEFKKRLLEQIARMESKNRLLEWSQRKLLEWNQRTDCWMRQLDYSVRRKAEATNQQNRLLVLSARIDQQNTVGRESKNISLD